MVNLILFQLHAFTDLIGKAKYPYLLWVFQIDIVDRLFCIDRQNRSSGLLIKYVNLVLVKYALCKYIESGYQPCTSEDVYLIQRIERSTH